MVYIIYKSPEIALSDTIGATTSSHCYFVITFWMMNWGQMYESRRSSRNIKGIRNVPPPLDFLFRLFLENLPAYFHSRSYWSKQQWILRIVQTIYQIENDFFRKRLWLKGIKWDRNWIRWGGEVRLVHPLARLEWNPCSLCCCCCCWCCLLKEKPASWDTHLASAS